MWDVMGPSRVRALAVFISGEGLPVRRGAKLLVLQAKAIQHLVVILLICCMLPHNSRLHAACTALVAGLTRVQSSAAF